MLIFLLVRRFHGLTWPRAFSARAIPSKCLSTNLSSVPNAKMTTRFFLTIRCTVFLEICRSEATPFGLRELLRLILSH